MPEFRCVRCNRGVINSRLPLTYAGTCQCDHCGIILRVRLQDGLVTHVSLRKTDIECPAGVPDDLAGVFSQALTCYENDCFAASLVMVRLFTEGMFKKAQIPGKRLVEQIENAFKQKKISQTPYSLATVSRLKGNIGAHYTDELGNISEAECRFVLDLARQLAKELVEDGLLTERVSAQAS